MKQKMVYLKGYDLVEETFVKDGIISNVLIKESNLMKNNKELKIQL